MRRIPSAFLASIVLATMMQSTWAADNTPAHSDAASSKPAGAFPVDTPTNSVLSPKSGHHFSLSTSKEALKLTDDVSTAKAQVDAHPDDPEAHFLLAAAYSRSPYIEQAFQEMKTTKNLLKAKQDFEFIDRTIPQYEKLSQEDPKNTAILYRLSMAYFFKGYSLEKYPQHYKNTPTGTAAEYYEKARSTMEHVISLDPKDTWARNYLGYLIADNGKDLPKGIPTWEQSLSIDKETNPGAYYMLSQAYLKKGDIMKSISYGAKGLAIRQRMGMTTP